MSVLRSLLTNTVLVIVGRLSAKVLTAVFIAFLARAVGPAGVGKYAFAGSLVAMMRFGEETKTYYHATYATPLSASASATLLHYTSLLCA